MEKWESRVGVAEISYSSSRRKKELGWGPREDFDDEVKISLKTDMEYLSFVDVGQTDPEDLGGENNQK
jgi:hypothetical protein